MVAKDKVVRGIIGVNDWERKERQDVLVNLVLYADLRQAGRDDDLTATVNYRSVAKMVIAHVETSSRFTLEALATDVAKLCLTMSGVNRVRVRLEKPGAVRFARTVAVEIERGREDFA